MVSYSLRKRATFGPLRRIFPHMIKFYFHVRRGDTVFEDSEGRDLSGVDEAVAIAVQDAREIMAFEPEVLPSGQWIEVADRLGNRVRTVPFETVV